MRTRILALFVALALRTASADALPPLPAQPAGVPWPTQEWAVGEPAGVDRARLAAASDDLFRTTGRGGLPDTRALLVVQGGAIVLERYASGFGPESRFVSWSMAKSVTQALVGILVRDGVLVVEAPAAVPEWSAGGDPRAAITLDQMLHMTSGVANGDGERGDGDTVGLALLFGSGSRDLAGFAASFPLAHPPGTRWDYSTATSALLAAIVGRAAGGGRDATASFIKRELYEPLGMRPAVPEFDDAGTFLGGSSVWASARDWARFGLLYLRDGTWETRRILPAGWVDYTRTPGKVMPTYGAHLWLNGDEAERPQLAGAPASVFFAGGANGQFVAIAPTLDVVAVRLGEAQATTEDDVGSALGGILALFPTRAGN